MQKRFGAVERAISLIMCFAIVFSSLAFVTSAEEVDTQQTQEVSEQSQQEIEDSLTADFSDLVAMSAEFGSSETNASQWTGSGTETDPYQITTIGDLQALADAVNAGNACANVYFKQTMNIDDAFTTPIGNSSYAFGGNYDGDGYRTNVVIDSSSKYSSSSYVGMFGKISGTATIKNVNVYGDITAKNYVGGVCGYAYGGATLDNCVNYASVHATASTSEGGAGGVCGCCQDSTTKNCANAGAILSDSGYVGGVCGQLIGTSENSATITNCSNSGAISNYNADNMGGICGCIHTYGTVQGCANTGEIVTDRIKVGGIVGGRGYDNTSKNSIVNIESCSNSGHVKGTSNTAGICGYSDATTYIQSCTNTGAVEGSTYVAGICGYSKAKIQIQNCSNEGQVEGTDGIGGICGYINATSSKVEDCTNKGNIKGTDNTGGIGGSIYSTEMKNCTNTGAVDVTGVHIGGVCGYVNSSKVFNSYNLGNVTTTSTSSDADIGGVVGYFKENSTLQNCYNAGTVSGGKYIGGICGNMEKGTVSLSYWLSSSASQGSGKGNLSEGCYAFEKADGQTPTITDLSGILLVNQLNDNIKAQGKEQEWHKWYTDTATFYPAFSGSEETPTPEPEPTPGEWSGSGTASNPYIIASYDDLKKLADAVNSGTDYSNTYFRQDADIDGVDFRIGTDACAFSGIYDGNGKTTTLNINASDTSYIGMFGYIKGATIKNLTVGGTVKGLLGVGGICGYADNYSSIDNCQNNASVTGYSDCVGGICGYPYYSKVANCYNTASVAGYSSVGGICGYATDSTIVSICYNTDKASVTSVAKDGSYIGGVCGYATNSSTVSNCYNAANITLSSLSAVAGICGYANTSTIDGCYNSATIEGAGGSGGICGKQYGGEIINCINSSSAVITGNGNSIGGICGLTGSSTVSIKYCTNDGKVTNNNDNTGGILGCTGGNIVTNIESCTNTGEISATGWNTGGIQGGVSNNSSNPTIKNCSNSASVTSDNPRTGGVIGYMEPGYIDSCTNSGAVTGGYTTSTYGFGLGGICGQLGDYSDGAQVINCSNSGDVKGTNSSGCIGGICGNILGNDVAVLYCDNSGKIECPNKYAGGISSIIPPGGRIEYCYNTGTVTGPNTLDYAGGICSEANSNCKISCCYNTGEVAGCNFIGGICGQMYNSYSDGTSYGILKCYNTGKIGFTNDGGSYYIGGICGYQNYSSIKDCYNTGPVLTQAGSYSDYVGGICGYSHSHCRIQTCYNRGDVGTTNYTNRTGGIAGYEDYYTYIKYSYNASLNINGGWACLIAYSDDYPEVAFYFAYTITGNDKLLAYAHGYNIRGNYSNCIITITQDDSSSPPKSTYSSSYLVDELNAKYGQNAWEEGSWNRYPTLKLSADDKPSSGTTYSMYSASHLQAFAESVSSNQSQSAVLAKDITMPPDKNWTPIASGSSYSGTFDGQGHSITNLQCKHSSSSDQGLFDGLGISGTIKNLKVSGNVEGYSHVGGISGDASGTIENCSFSGSVTGSGSCIGGIAGGGESASIKNCYNFATVSGPDSTGGIFGSQKAGTVTNCYNAGSVSGTSRVGGIGGYISDSNGRAENCYWSNTSLKAVGQGTYKDCYTFKLNDAGTDYIVPDCENEKLVNKLNETASSKNYKYWEPDLNSSSSTYLYPIWGSLPGTTNPEVSKTKDLKHIKEMVEKGFSYKSVSISQTEAVPCINFTIGAYSNLPFEGSYNGNSHTINLYLKTSSNNVGLFVYNKGTLVNVHTTGTVSGASNVGAVCAYNSGTIDGCTNNNTSITASSGYLGGICGYCIDGTIKNCKNEVTISGAGEGVGGVCGVLYGSTDQNSALIDDCSNLADVSNNNAYDTGGICGLIKTNGSITNCTNSGKVSSNNCYVGGIVGAAGYGKDNSLAIIGDCTNSGNITSDYSSGSKAHVGGILGHSDISVEVEHCSNSGLVKGNDECVGGIGGYLAGSSSIINDCTNSGSVSSKSYTGGVCGYYEGNSSKTVSCTNSGLVSGEKYTGGIGGYYKNSTMENCSNSASVSGTGIGVGGVAGLLYGSTDENSAFIIGCSNSGDVSNNNNYDTGGVCGVIYSNGTVRDCTNSGNVSSNNAYVGGVVGARGYNGTLAVIENCSNSGNVSSTYTQEKPNIGGILGHSDMPTKMINCTNSGSIKGSGDNIGGVWGNSSGKNTEISNCTNLGTVSGNNCISGILGYSSGNDASMDYCTNLGTVSGKEDSVAGVLGSSSGSNTTMNVCTNAGAISGRSLISGIWGENCGDRTDISVKNSKNLGTINCSYDHSGIISNAYGTFINDHNMGTIKSPYYQDKAGGISTYNGNATIDRCYNSGNIENNSNVKYVGGISAFNSNSSTIKNSFNIANMSGGTTKDVAGIVGYSDSTSNLSYCLNKGNVSSDVAENMAGIVAESTNTGNKILSCINTGTIEGKNIAGIVSNFKGAALAHNSNEGTVKCTSSDGTTAGIVRTSDYVTAAIEQCHNSGTIEGGSVAGIASNFKGTLLSNSSNEGALKGTSSNGTTAGIVITSDSTGANILNCHNSGSIEGDGAFSGIVYSFAGGDISYCENTANIAGTKNASGIVENHTNTKGSNIYDCKNTGKIEGANVAGIVSNFKGEGLSTNSNEGALKGTSNDGTIAGIVIASDNANASIFKCNNSGSIESTGTSSGIACSFAGLYISDSNNTANITGTKNTSGIVENYAGTNGSISNCTNTGKIEGGVSVAGLVSSLKNVNITDSVNTGNINNTGGTDGFTGGLVGKAENLTIVNAANEGTLTANSTTAGGLCGQSTGTSISNSLNKGNISVAENCTHIGGIVGSTSSNTNSLTNCYNSAAITGGNSSNVGGIFGGNLDSSNVMTFKKTYYLANSNYHAVAGETQDETNTKAMQDADMKATAFAEQLTVNALNHDDWKEWQIPQNGGYPEHTWLDHNITVYYSKTMGQISSDKATAKIGETVTLTPEMNSGYALKEGTLRVVGDEGREIFPTKTSDNTYTFTMPKFNVATFAVVLRTNQPVEYAPIGDGSSYSPYQITDENTLIWFMNEVNGTNNHNPNPSACATITKDIDMIGVQFNPIGNDSRQYTGTFDGGKDKQITGLVSYTDSSYVGMFGYIGEKGIVKNVNLYGVGGMWSTTKTSSTYTGAICGYNAGKIESSENHIVVLGQATDDISSAGGICGYNAGTITDCIDSGKIAGRNVGGICGTNTGTVINNCNNSDGLIKPNSPDGATNLGGICGYNNNGTVANNYNKAEIKSTASYDTGVYTGGICGSSTGTILNSYNVGKTVVICSDTSPGSICSNNTGTVENTYYLEGTAEKGLGNSASEEEAKAKKMTDTDMKSSAFATTLSDNAQSHADWKEWQSATNDYPVFTNLSHNVNIPTVDFGKAEADPSSAETGSTVTLTITPDDGYKLKDGSLKAINTDTGKDIPLSVLSSGTVYTFEMPKCEVNVELEFIRSVSPIQPSGDGSPANPYKIGNIANLVWFATSAKMTDYAILTADIDMIGYEWIPIGNTENPYTGIFDADGHVIQNLTCKTDGSEIGLFGAIATGAEIKNLGLQNEKITATGDTIGGICGINLGGLITNCYSNVDIQSNSSIIGGICGTASIDSTVDNCYVTGKIAATGDTIGAVCGSVDTGAKVLETYFLQGVSARGIGEGAGTATDKTDPEMKSTAFSEELTKNATQNITWREWKTDASATYQYPIFTYLTHNVGSYNGEYGTVTPEQATVTTNDTAILVVEPKDNYSYKEGTLKVTYTIGEQTAEITPTLIAGTDNKYSFTMPKYDVSVTATFIDAPTKPAGDGTAAYPYQITNANELLGFGIIVEGGNIGNEIVESNQNAYGILVNDINLTTTMFTPIGSNTHPYLGVFDGNAHTINNLTLNCDTNVTGLFGYIGSTGTVENLGLLGGSITSTDTSKNDTQIGALCGHNDGLIVNCFNANNFNVKIGTTAEIGGICGLSSSTGQVINCYNTGTLKEIITEGNSIGSVIGYADSGATIKNNYYLEGTATQGIGNLADETGKTESKTDTYMKTSDFCSFLNTGNDTVKDNMAYFEWALPDSTSTYPYPYQTNLDHAIVVNNATHGTIEIEGKELDENKTTYAKSREEVVIIATPDVNYVLKEGSLTVNFPNGEILYPTKDEEDETKYTFTMPKKDTSDVGVTGTFEQVNPPDPVKPSGDGSQLNPYQINNVAELLGFQIIVNGGEIDNVKYDPAPSSCAILMKSIQMNGIGWEPLGNPSSQYTGTFDGNGKAITYLRNLEKTATDEVYEGMFGYIGKDGLVKNLGLVNTITGNDTIYKSHLGAIAGYNAGTIENCYSLGTKGVAATSKETQHIGGICGTNVGTILNCYNTQKVGSEAVGAQDKIGSICGSNAGTIASTYYLEGTTSKGIGEGSGVAIEKTADEMKSQNLVDTLNTVRQNRAKEKEWCEWMVGVKSPIFCIDSLTRSANTAVQHKIGETTTEISIAGIEDPTQTYNIQQSWSDGKGSYIYIGRYADSKNPIAFRVLDPSTKDFSTGDTPSMLIDCDTVLEKHVFNNDTSQGNSWSSSDIRTYMNSQDFITKYFSLEDNAKLIANSSDPTSHKDWEQSESNLNYTSLVNGDKLFLLDSGEVNSHYGYYNDNNSKSRMKNLVGSSSLGYWLRSNATGTGLENKYAGVIDSKGQATHLMVSGDSDRGISPAMNVDLSKVVFSSATSKVNEFKSTDPQGTSGTSANTAWTLGIQATDEAPKVEITPDRTGAYGVIVDNTYIKTIGLYSLQVFAYKEVEGGSTILSTPVYSEKLTSYADSIKSDGVICFDVTNIPDGYSVAAMLVGPNNAVWEFGTAKLVTGNLVVQLSDSQSLMPADAVVNIMQGETVKAQAKVSDFVDGKYTFKDIQVGQYTIDVTGDAVAGYDVVTHVNPETIKVSRNSTTSVTVSNEYTVKTIYTVVYNANGGSDVETRTNVAWTDSNLLEGKTTTRENYSLSGWNTQADGKGMTVDNTTTYAQIAGSEEKTQVEIFAQWAEKPSAPISVDDLEVNYGDKSAKINVEIVKNTDDPSGVITYKVTSGTDVVAVNEHTGDLLIKKVGDAEVTVTVQETEAYAKTEKISKVTVLPASVSITEPPTTSAITYGQTLSNSTLTGGQATVNDTPIEGKFVWADESTMPKVADSLLTNYDIQFVPTDNENFGIETCQARVEVKAKELTIQASAGEKVYDGTTGITVSGQIAEGGVVAGDEVVLQIEGQLQNPNAGDSQNVEITKKELVGDDAPNYVFNDTEITVTAKVTRKEVTPVITAETKKYDRTTEAVLNVTSETGVSGETMSIIGITGNFEDANIGENKTITLDTSNAQVTVLGGAGSVANYDIKYPETITGNIIGVEIELTETPTASAINYSNKLSDSVLSGGKVAVKETGLDVSGQFEWTNPDTMPEVGHEKAYEVKFTPEDANYSTFTLEVVVPVNTKGITVTGKPTARIYDSTTIVEVLTEIESSQIETGEEVTVTPTTGTLDQANAGVGRQVTLTDEQKSAVVLGGKDSANYSINEIVLTPNTVDITKKSVSATVKVLDKYYDGTVDATVEVVADSGVAGEAMTITGVTGKFDTPDIGENKKVTIDSSKAVVTVTGGSASADNYSITYPTEATGNIVKYPTHKITSQATEGGIITPLGEIEVKEGSSQKFVATPNTGYKLDKFIIDGEETNLTDNTYTFDDVKVDHTIQAVFVVDPLIVAKIEITKQPDKLEYKIGEEFDPTGMVITALYTNGTKAEVTGYTITGFDSTKVGEKTVTIGYSGKTATLKVTVKGETGWKQNSNGTWSYLDNGTPVKGWKNDIPGWNDWFYFDNSGIMKTSWQLLNWSGGQNWFYFNSNGTMVAGLQELNWSGGRNWFYFDTNGAMRVGWQGQVTGWEGEWFFFDGTTGVMKTGWHFLPWSGGTDWFDFRSNGTMYVNCITPDGYRVDENGKWIR